MMPDLDTIARRLNMTSLGVRFLIAGLVSLALWALIIGGFVAIERHGRAVERERALAAAMQARDEAAMRDLEAKEAAAAQRAVDQAAASQLQTDLRNSYATAPDSAPSRVRLALECRRMRGTPAARGAEFSRLCGPDGGAQAAPAH